MLRGMDAFEGNHAWQKKRVKISHCFFGMQQPHFCTLPKSGARVLFSSSILEDIRRLNLFQKSCARSRASFNRASFKIFKPEHGLHHLEVHRVIITEAA